MEQASSVAQLMKLINGFQISQAISVAAALGIADLMKDGPLHSDAIAAATKCEYRSMYRLLHALGVAGILDELSERRFRLTAIGECLRSDSPNSRAAWARFVGRRYVWNSWGDLHDSVRTGAAAFERLHGANLWEWRSQRPEEAEIFDAAMSELSGAVGSVIASAHDFSRYDVIVDVGGGQGALLAAVLAKHATVRGILFDLPHVVAKAEQMFQVAGVADRCRIVGGDAFKAIPKDGSAYLIKNVLMDEDDDGAIAILKGCRSVMRPSGRVVVIEHLLAPSQPGTHLSDLTMLVMTGGHERTQAEFAALFSAAGLNIECVVPTQSPLTLVIGAPA